MRSRLDSNSEHQTFKNLPPHALVTRVSELFSKCSPCNNFHPFLEDIRLISHDLSIYSSFL